MVILVTGLVLVLLGSRGLRSARDSISRGHSLRDIKNIASPVSPSSCSSEPDPRLHLVTVVLGPSASKRDFYFADVKALLTQVLSSSKRGITLHVMTNAWDDTPELGARADLAAAQLMRNPRIDYVPYRYCELWLNESTGTPTCPPAGSPASPLPGGAEFTRMYSSFERQWPRNDAVHPDTEAYVLKVSNMSAHG